MIGKTGPNQKANFHEYSYNEISTYDSTKLRDFSKVNWKFKTGGMIVSSPIISNGKVFIGSNDRNLYVLDESTGQELWRFVTKGEVNSSPAILQNTLCFGSSDGYYYAVNIDTGKEIWRFKTEGQYKIGRKGLWGMTPTTLYMEDQYDFFISSPVFHTEGDDKTVYFGSSDGYLYALNAENGNLIWQFKTNGPIRSTPAIDKGVLFIGSWDTHVYAINLKNGKEIWKYKTGSDLDHNVLEGIQASATVAYDRIYIGARDGFLHAINAKTGEMEWKFNAENSWIVSTAAVGDSTVYITTSDSYLLIALNAITGTERFKIKTHGYNLGSPVLAQGRIFLGDFSGMLYSINPISGEVQGKFETESRKNNKTRILDEDGNLNFEYTADGMDMQLYETNVKVLRKFFQLGPFVSAPTLSKNTLYIGSTEGNLYALHLK